MKKDIHPKYFEKAKITCVCGNSIETGSAEERLEVEICSKCHPFYTGRDQLIDTAGRVERFRTRKEKAENVTGKSKKIRTKKNAKKQP